MTELNKTNSNYKVRLSSLLGVLIPIVILISLLFGVSYLFGGGGIAGAIQVALAIGMAYGLGDRRLKPILLPRES